MEEIKVSTMEGAVVALLKANNRNANILLSLKKANKHLSIAVLCLTAAGYLVWCTVNSQGKKIAALEQTVNSLVQIAAGAPANPQQEAQTESE